MVLRFRREAMIMVVWLVAGSACGRIAFDPIGPDRTAASCETLAPTCGPTGTSPCCESPVVTGGTFYRSYDVGTDGMYPDMSYPATVDTFRLDKYEVTVGRFRQFVEAGMGTQLNPPLSDGGRRTLNGIANQGGWDPTWNASLDANTASLVAAVKCNSTYQTWTDTPAGNENRPMNCLTWYEAMAFCVWDGGFLPTEAEWNYAASGGSLARAYPWSSPASSLVNDDTTYASYFVDATKQCYGDMTNGCAPTDFVPVGTKPAGDGLWGQSDLGGNVWEWVLDGFASPYPMATCDNCANLTIVQSRVFRGGSAGFDDSSLRTAKRGADLPSNRFIVGLGVRCARLAL